ncbi:MAG: endonuclease domain-containing protein [Cyanobacteria bacterium P01_H01_bin.152]
MTDVFNQRADIEKRRRLRQNATPAEQLVWQRLRDRQVENCKFRRQYSVDAFVLDFYCPELRLAIEIDGDSHISEEAVAYDLARQRTIEALGIQFLRFTNREVYGQLDTVIEQIAQTVRDLRA